MSVTRKVALALSVMFSISAVPAAFSQTQMNQYGSTSVMQSQQTVIPAGTSLTIRENGFASASGDIFTGQLVSPIRMNGAVVIPAGSSIQGTVVGANAAANARNIQLDSITLPTGNTIAFNSAIAVPMPVGVAAVREEPLSGQVTRTGGWRTLYPRVTWGPEGASPAAKVIGGTVGGAALGAATGTLGTLTMRATNRGMRRTVSRGTAAAQGLAWGAAYGAGFGLISGLIDAATTPSPVAVTSTSTQTASTQSAGQVYTVAMADPVAIGMGPSSMQQTYTQQTFPQESMTPVQPISPVQEQQMPVQQQAPVRGYW